jgi:hypothetical protein
LRSRYAARARPRNAALGALALGTFLSGTALALADEKADPPSLDPTALRVADARVGYREPVVVHGRLDGAAAMPIALQARVHRRWRTVASGVTEADGSYSMSVRLRSSAVLRIVPLAVRDATGLVADGAAAAATTPSGGPQRRVAVAARLKVHKHDRDVQAGTVVRVRGTLLPRLRGRRIVLEGASGGHWRRLAVTRTRSGGRFEARVAASRLGTTRLRVRFAGDTRNAATKTRIGTLQVYRAALASWYALYGNRTACGQTLGTSTLGVAHRWLPCGTKVTLRYHGRELTVPVIDRGPYAAGREWDLTGATARQLGFSGAGVIWSSR